MFFASWESATPGKNFFDIYNALYFHYSLYLFYVILLCCYCLCTFLIWQFIIEQFFLKHTELILTVSKSSSVYSCETSCSILLTDLLFLLQQTFQKCPILLHSMHFLPYAGHCLGECVPPQFLHGCHCLLLWCINVFVLLSFTLLNSFILSNCLDSVNVFNTVTWSPCTSTLLGHANTPPLVIWSLFFCF